ncbi:retrovirus-related pol polyprotein from transposon TNT 1-94 [Tanacetum coccineum]
MSSGFQPRFTPKLIQSSQQVQSSQNDLKIQKDYKIDYKKVKAKLALLEASPSSTQSPNLFSLKTKVLMALADDELVFGKNYAINGEWIDIIMRNVNILLSMDEDANWKNYLKDDLLVFEQEKLEAVTFQFQNTELIKQNHTLQEQLKEEKYVNEKWLKSSTKIRTDNGAEFRNSEHESYCDEKGISQKLSSPYTPEQNDEKVNSSQKIQESKPMMNHLRHNHVILVRGGVLAESSRPSEFLVGMSCNTCGSIVHLITDHNDFKHFKRGEKLQATKAKEPTKNGCSKSMNGVKSYLHKYVKQPGPKEFGALHEGISLQNLNEFFHVSFEQDDRRFISQAWNRLFRIKEQVVREYVMEFLSSFTFRNMPVNYNPTQYVLTMTSDTHHRRHSRKEKVTLDDLFLLHNMDGGVSVDVPWYNGLGVGEMVAEILEVVGEDDVGAEQAEI